MQRKDGIGAIVDGVDMVGAGLVGGKLHLIAGSFPAGLLTAPLHIAVGVLHIGGKGHLVAYRGRVRSTDGNGGRVSLHGDFDLRGGEGTVDLDARLDGVLARVGAGEGEGAAVLFQFVVDRPLDVGVAVILAAQLDRGGDGDALALLDGAVALVQLQLDAGIIEHSRDRNVLVDDVVTGGIGDAVAPLIEGVAIGRHGGHADLGAAGNLKIQTGNAGLVIAGQGALAVLDTVAGGQFIGGSGRGRGGAAAVACCRGRTLRDLSAVAAGILHIVGVVLDVIQHDVDAGAGEAAGGGIHVAVHGVALVVLHDFRQVQVLEAHIVAGDSQLLVVLVNVGLLLGGVGGVLGDGRNGAGHHVAGGVGRLDALQDLLVVVDELVHADRTVQIIAAHHDVDVQGLHLGDGLGDGVAVGVVGKVDAGLTQHLGDLQPILAGVLV